MSDPFYFQQPWRAFRKAFLSRHPWCAVAGCGHPATAVDHIIRRSTGGQDFPPDSGLRAYCASHHNAKTRRHDQPGKTGPYVDVLKGCDAKGWPADRNHHWNR